MNNSKKLNDIITKAFSTHIVWTLIVFLGIIGSFVSSTFLKPINLLNILNQSIPIAMMVFGMGFLLLVGRIDLSLESTFAFAPIISILIITEWLPQIPPIFGVLITLIIGMIIGAINGFLSVKLGVNDFLVGLAMMLFLRGIVKFLIPEGVYGLPQSFTFMGGKRILNNTLPISIFILFIIFIILYLITKKTPFGRKILATGSSGKAAFIAGIDIVKVEMTAFVVSGLLASLGGIIAVGRQMAATNSMGDGNIIKVLAAAVLGGISMDGGFGTITGALGGALLLQMINNILALSGVNPILLDSIFGFILLAAIVFQGVRSQKAK